MTRTLSPRAQPGSLKPEACQPLAGGRAQRHPRIAVSNLLPIREGSQRRQIARQAGGAKFAKRLKCSACPRFQRMRRLPEAKRPLPVTKKPRSSTREAGLNCKSRGSHARPQRLYLPHPRQQRNASLNRSGHRRQRKSPGSWSPGVREDGLCPATHAPPLPRGLSG